jgi:hypothetical protein
MTDERPNRLLQVSTVSLFKHSCAALPKTDKGLQLALVDGLVFTCTVPAEWSEETQDRQTTKLSS